MRILFITPCNPYLPSGIVRAQNYFPYLKIAEIDYNHFNYLSSTAQRIYEWQSKSGFKNKFLNSLITNIIHIFSVSHRLIMQFYICLIANRYDAIFLQRILLPGLTLAVLKKRNQKLIFDFDDSIFISDPERTAAMVKSAWFVLAGSHFLFDYAKNINQNTILLPSPVKFETYSITDHQIPGQNPVRIGWIGGPSTLHYLRRLITPLRQLREAGIDFELWFAGTWNLISRVLPELSDMKVVEFSQYSDNQIPEIVSKFDIGVMPLDDGDWERGKCAMKAIICMAGGKPVVCSPVGEINYIIRDGINGFLANSDQDWVEKLTALIQNHALSKKMGEAGRFTVEESYTVSTGSKILMEKIFSRISNSDFSDK